MEIFEMSLPFSVFKVMLRCMHNNAPKQRHDTPNLYNKF